VTGKRVVVAVLAHVVWLLLPASAASAACTTVAGCSEWLDLPSSSLRLLVYRSFPLAEKNPAITRAVIVVHGAGRDADNYFLHMMAGAFLAGSLETTVVISPRFASTSGGCGDAVAEREARWPCGGPSRWTAGGGATDNETVTSYDAMDELIRTLARKDSFPNLQAIVLAGHSAGGQFVSRYQMANQVHDGLKLPVTYVVANPSSYAYLDPTRPSDTVINANVSALAPGYVPAPSAKPAPPFVPFGDAGGCTTYDRWPYGLQQRVGYTAKLSDEQLRTQASSRGSVYLLGGLDILPLFGFDGSCAAMAQGPTRLARGLAYAQYVNLKFGAKHDIRMVPSCGHNARCMFTENGALAVLFGKRP
jgi:pimeloyl-ACP methyl ester carboxylesterase